MAESVELATIWAVDLVGSTRLEASVGPVRADELRNAYFGLLREALEGAGGREFKNTGDGLLVAFSSASAAVSCAVVTQQLFERRYRGAEQQLHVRIGLGTGESTVKDGNYFGMPAIEAARLCAKAPVDGILVSALTKALAGRVEGAWFESAGELELKGLPELMEAFAVCWEPVDVEGSGAEVGRWPLPEALRTVPRVAYVGRESERGLLEHGREEARSGARQVVLLSGEPGIGKTRLASYAALAAHADGFEVVWGGCSEDLAAPYEPWIAVCSQLVEHAPDSALGEYVGRFGGEVSRLARNLGQRFSDAPAPQSCDPETERFLLFQAVAELLRAVAASVPLCVVLDDFHWADGQSVALLKHVARSVEQGALQVLVTYRDSDLAIDHTLTAVLADLHRVGGVERIALRGLADDDVAAMISAAAGHDLDAEGLALAGEIAVEAEGNPFFVGEILRNLSESGMLVFDEPSGRWRVDRGSAIALPESVREVVGRRVERLGEAPRQILNAASVLGRTFDLEVLARVLDRSEEDVLDGIEVAIGAAVVVESSERVGRFAFTHALISHTLYESMTATRRARMHQRVAEALEELYGTDPGERLAELALHWRFATVSVDVRKAVDYARRAGDQALEQLAPDDALRWFKQALELLGADAPDEQRCELLIAVGTAQKHAGDPAFRETLLEAGRIARSSGAIPLLVRATLANSRGWVAGTGGVDVERVEMLEEAISLLDPDSADRLMLCAQLAAELAYTGQWQRVHGLVDESLSKARARGDRPLLAHVLHWACAAQLGSADGARTLWDLSGELEQLADELADPVRRWAAVQHRSSAALLLGEADEADRCVAAMAAGADQLGQPALRWSSAYNECARQLMYGNIAAAEASAYRAAALGHESGQPDTLVITGVQLFAIRLEQGRLDELIEILEQRAIENPGLPALQAMLAAAYVELDRLDDARAIFEPIAADGFASLPRDVTWLNGMGRFADVAARLEATAAGAAIYEQLLPYRDRILSVIISVNSSVERPLGRLAALLGRWDLAEDHFVLAQAVHERIGAKLSLARTSMNHGRALLMRGATEDRPRAAELLQRAITVGVECGGAAVAREAELLLVDQLGTVAPPAAGRS